MIHIGYGKRYDHPIEQTEQPRMGYEAINFGKTIGLFAEQWPPKIIAG